MKASLSFLRTSEYHFLPCHTGSDNFHRIREHLPGTAKYILNRIRETLRDCNDEERQIVITALSDVFYCDTSDGMVYLQVPDRVAAYADLCATLSWIPKTPLPRQINLAAGIVRKTICFATGKRFPLYQDGDQAVSLANLALRFSAGWLPQSVQVLCSVQDDSEDVIFRT